MWIYHDMVCDEGSAKKTRKTDPDSFGSGSKARARDMAWPEQRPLSAGHKPA